MNQQICIHTCIYIERHIQTYTSPNGRDLISRWSYVESIFTCIHLDRCRERPVQTAVILSPEVTRRRLFLSLTTWNSTLFLPSTLKPKGNCSINSGGLCRVATYSVRHFTTWNSVCFGMVFIRKPHISKDRTLNVYMYLHMCRFWKVLWKIIVQKSTPKLK